MTRVEVMMMISGLGALIFGIVVFSEPRLALSEPSTLKKPNMPNMLRENYGCREREHSSEILRFTRANRGWIWGGWKTAAIWYPKIPDREFYEMHLSLPVFWFAWPALSLKYWHNLRPVMAKPSSGDGCSGYVLSLNGPQLNGRFYSTQDVLDSHVNSSSEIVENPKGLRALDTKGSLGSVWYSGHGVLTPELSDVMKRAVGPVGRELARMVPKSLGPLTPVRLLDLGNQERVQYGYGENQVEMVISVEPKTREPFPADLLPIPGYLPFRGISDGLGSAVFFRKGSYCVRVFGNRPLGLLARWSQKAFWPRGAYKMVRV